jgi:glycosyltransferase involved in cell wall biosynthesis
MNRLDEDACVEYSDAAELIKRPEVSVIMVTYNHERYLAEAIEGVIRQKTSFPVELLIGEDCSTDGTREIALSYQKRFPEMIRVITSEHNVGARKNFDRLIAAARGQYIAFCEGDDFWHRPDKLQRQIAVLQGDPSVIMVCSSWRVVSSGGTLLKEDGLASRHIRMSEISSDDVLSLRVVMTLTVCAQRCYVQKALCESPLCGNHSYPFGDAPLWFELTRYGKCCCVPEVFTSYRLSENSATRRADPLHAYRFNSKACEFRNDALDLYPLAQGEGATRVAKISATRSRLRAVAVLGDLTTAKEQLRRLRSLNVIPTLGDKLLCCTAHIPLPRAALAPAITQGVRLWHSVRKGTSA